VHDRDRAYLKANPEAASPRPTGLADGAAAIQSPAPKPSSPPQAPSNRCLSFLPDQRLSHSPFLATPGGRRNWRPGWRPESVKGLNLQGFEHRFLFGPIHSGVGADPALSRCYSADLVGRRAQGLRLLTISSCRGGATRRAPVASWFSFYSPGQASSGSLAGCFARPRAANPKKVARLKVFLRGDGRRLNGPSLLRGSSRGAE